MINNTFYEELKDDWYTSQDHPIALLRAENKLRAPWILSEIKGNVLDVGCGGGFLSNYLAKQGVQVTGIDISPSSVEVAKKYDTTRTVHYQVADAYQLPFADQSFDNVCAMDILEHVNAPEKLIAEASRVLRPGGKFFFHTFNRNFLSYLLIIKAVDWFVPNAPKDMHVYPLFIKPSELEKLCLKTGLHIRDLKGFVPDMAQKAFWQMPFANEIPEDFTFKFTKSTLTGYCGYACKN